MQGDPTRNGCVLEIFLGTGINCDVGYSSLIYGNGLVRDHEWRNHCKCFLG